MWQPVNIIFLFYIFLQIVIASDIRETALLSDNAIKLSSYVYWPNGTIPFYIEENHFDYDQKTEIETTLTLIAQKTCLKFLPVLTPPTTHQHVLVFTNPGGVRKCVLNTDGHPRDAPHKVTLGYNCLKSPHIEMVIMKALGFGFEHNRASRDVYIDVQQENIDMAFMNLFTKDNKLPIELQALPYDVNSVLHFGERDYSKNGHRTIIFKDHRVKQNRDGLSPLDLQKIEIVYGPECQKRNRQEKIELCQTYPGIARRKRELEPEHQSLRVNPDITPPPEILNLNTEEVKQSTDVELILKELGIVNEVQKVIDQVHKVSSLAFQNARLKYCNGSKPDLRASPNLELKKSSDILGVIEMVANFAKSMVDNAVANITTFCMESDTADDYQRARCDLFGPKQTNCIVQYKSTKSGPVKYSTQHRPLIRQSTKHDGIDKPILYGNKFGYHRSRNDSDETVAEVAKDGDVTKLTTKVLRRKRGVSSEIFRSKRHVQLSDNTSDENVAMVVDTATTENRSKDNLRMVTTAHPNGDRRKFEVRRYNVKHKNDQSTEQNWDNSHLSTEVKFTKDIVGSYEREQRNEDVDGEEITKVKNYKDIRHSEDDKSERPQSIQVYQDETRWVDKDMEDKNLNGNRFVKTYKEPDIDDMDENPEEKREVKKYRKRPDKFDREETLEDKREVTKHEQRPEIENKKDHLEGNRHVKKYKERPDKYNRDESMEETRVGKKYRKRPGRDDMEESQEEKREVKKYRYPPERGNKESYSKENRHIKKYTERPGSDYREESLEEKRKVKEYNERPNRHKSPEKARRPPVDSSEESRSFKPRTVRLTRLNREFYDERRWPGGVVPYYIQEDPGYDTDAVRRRLEEVNRILVQRTCVRLQELNERQLSRHQDYMILDTSADFITGRVGGKQNFGCLELFRGGQHRQHAAMVVMAMLGFYFELARHDRDKYVRVHLRHVRPDKLHHFEKIRADGTLPLPYDYRSASHPAWQFWRKLGRTGISSVATYKHLDPDGTVMKSLGQNEQLLSDLDIVKINSVYGTECFNRQRTGDLHGY